MTTPCSEQVTACVVAYHEETVIARCIRSLERITDRVIVVHDGPCADRTVDLCKDMGCTVHVRDHVGMCEGHRVFAYQQAETPWILQIDADEFLSDELVQCIPDLVRDPEVACYEFLWPYWDGHAYRTRHGPWKRALFRKDRVQYLAFPHEEIRPLGPLVRCACRVEHRPGYDNYAFRALFQKHRKWIRIHARYHLMEPARWERFPADGPSMTPHYHGIVRAPLLAAPLVLAYHFAGLVVCGGYREGWIGWRNAAVQALYYFLLCVEVHRARKRPGNDQ